MRRVLALSWMLCVFVAAASAQSSHTNWKGFYIGGNAGGHSSTSDAQTSTVFSPTGYFATTSVPAIATYGNQKPDAHGFTGGGQFGFNLQKDRFVAGFEADFGALLLRDTQSNGRTYPCCAPTAFNVTQSVKTDWLFTARPRIGVTAGHFLLYATGGLALTNFNYQAVFTDTFATAHENGGVSGSKTGWTAGGGIEYQLPDHSHWSMRLEYLYANFGRVTTTSTNLTAFTPPVSFPDNVFTHSAHLQSHIARFGVNYRF